MPKELKLPRAPQNLNASDVTDSTVTLSWTYDGDESLNLTMNGNPVEGLNNPMVITGLTPNTKYDFILSTQTSNLSTELSVTTLEKEPEIPEVPALPGDDE